MPEQKPANDSVSKRWPSGRRGPRLPAKLSAAIRGIPDEIRSGGRVAGFEALRDALLAHWPDLVRVMSPAAVIKAILETDRHAVFAQVAEEKARERFDLEAWRQFQDWLRGRIDVPPAPRRARELPSAPEDTEMPKLSDLIPDPDPERLERMPSIETPMESIADARAERERYFGRSRDRSSTGPIGDGRSD